MLDKKKKELLTDIDLESIVKKSVRKANPLLETHGVVSEAYVTEPKSFNQVSEHVSQSTKDSHELLYKSYAKELNAISSQLDTVDKAKANSAHSNFRSLKLDETYNMNAVWLHELYFANCFDPHSEVHMDSMAYLKLQRDFGSFDDWQRDFVACAMSAGEGWVVCGYHTYLQRYINTFISHHSSDVLLGLYPIAVVDMWSHSYYRDYLSDKKSYLISQMREFNWDVIEERFKKAESIAGVLK